MADFTYQSLLKNMADYQNQAGQEINPLYDLAIKQLQQSGNQQQIQSNDMAAARGFGQSGLAVDQQNKIASATQNSIAQQLAEKNAKLAERARSMYESDRSFDSQNRSQLFGEYSNNRNFDYQKQQDGIKNNQWQTQFDYGKSQDATKNNQWQTQFDYGKSQDTVKNGQWQQDFELQKKKLSMAGSGRSSGSGSNSNSGGSVSSNLANQYAQFKAQQSAPSALDSYYQNQEQQRNAMATFGKTGPRNPTIGNPNYLMPNASIKGPFANLYLSNNSAMNILNATASRMGQWRVL